MSLFSKDRRKSELSSDPHRWDFPTSFRSWGLNSSPRKPTVIPAQDIFRDVFIPYLEVTRDNAVPSLVQYPTAGQLAVHLCLIECFTKLKQNVESVDSFEHAAPPSYSSVIATDSKARASISISPAAAAQKWDMAVRLAVDRFKVWFEKIESTLRHASFYNRLGTSSHSRGAFSKDYLPPLDVLLVWYSYMTQPAAYRKDNLAHSTSLLLDVCFPWDSILQIIDQDTMDYNLPEPARKLFTTLTSQSPDILTYLESPPAYSDLDEHKAFSLDLVTLVHDQAPFFDHSHQLLWIRSPALEGTLHRAMAQYGALSDAMESRAAAWTCHVDAEPSTQLVWRTHMLYPNIYHRFCRRIFQEENLLPAPGDVSLSEKPHIIEESAASASSGSCYCWTCESIRDYNLDFYIPPTPSLPSGMPLDLSPDDIATIKSDIGFHQHVESFRSSNPPHAPLPTRPPTKSDLARQKDEQDKRDRAGRYYGLGYTVEVVRPAVYDDTGRLVKPEKTRVRKDRKVSGMGGINALMLF